MEEPLMLRRSDRNRAPVTYAEEQYEVEVAKPMVSQPKRKVAVKSEEEVDFVLEQQEAFVSTEAVSPVPHKTTTRRKRVKAAKNVDSEGRLITDQKRPPHEKRPPKIYEATTRARNPNSPGFAGKAVPFFLTDREQPILFEIVDGERRLATTEPRPPGERRLPKVYDVDYKADNTHGPTKKLAPGEPEVRLKSYVNSPWESETYEIFLQRADTDRMVVLERSRHPEEDCHANHDDCPFEEVKIAGSRGNVYTVTITHIPRCTCPQAGYRAKQGACKHVLYVLHHVLKAPDHLRYQNAFLTSELKEIAASAPRLPSDVAEHGEKDGNRKIIEDDCPICCVEFEEGEDVTWCRAACGNNIHQSCFDKWAKAKLGRVTCPFCRTVWDYGDILQQGKVSMAEITMPMQRGPNGYYNVADQLGYA